MKKTNGFAIASLVLGICGFIPFIGVLCSIVAIIFGIVGINKSKKGYGGKGLAIAGLVLGGIGFLFTIISTVALIMSWGASFVEKTTGNSDISEKNTEKETTQLLNDCESYLIGFAPIRDNIFNDFKYWSQSSSDYNNGLITRTQMGSITRNVLDNAKRYYNTLKDMDYPDKLELFHKDFLFYLTDLQLVYADYYLYVMDETDVENLEESAQYLNEAIEYLNKCKNEWLKVCE